MDTLRIGIAGTDGSYESEVLGTGVQVVPGNRACWVEFMPFGDATEQILYKYADRFLMDSELPVVVSNGSLSRPVDTTVFIGFTPEDLVGDAASFINDISGDNGKIPAIYVEPGRVLFIYGPVTFFPLRTRIRIIEHDDAPINSSGGQFSGTVDSGLNSWEAGNTWEPTNTWE